MKVVFLTEFYPSSTDKDVRGGVELLTYHLSQGISSYHETVVIATRESQEPRIKRVGNVLTLRPGPAATFRQKGAYFSRARFALAARSVVIKNRPDVIVATNYLAYAIMLTLPSAYKRKTVLVYNDVWVGEWVKNVGPMMGMIGELIERFVFRSTWKQYVCISEATRQKVLRQHVAPSSTVVVHCGIDIAAIDRIPTERFGQPTIVYVARLVKYKRLDDVLRAMSILASRTPARLVVIGSGPEEANLKRLARDLKIENMVEWRGFVRKYEDVVSAIKGASVFTLPSAVEGFGIVTLESMACGTPYANSDIPPTREVTDGGVGGTLYPVGDYHRLADNLFQFLTDETARSKASRAGRAQAEKYNMPNIIEKFRACLESKTGSEASI